MAKWKITDYSTGSASVWTFPVNPNEATHPGRKAALKQEMATAPTGGTILFQGRDSTREVSFSGIVNSETFYTELSAQLDKYNALEITDDQGSTWNVVIKSYQMKRVRRALNQWRYDYEVKAIIV